MANRRSAWHILPALLVTLGLQTLLTRQGLVATSPATIAPDLLERLSDEGTANLFVQMSTQASLAPDHDMDWQTRGEVVWDALNRLAGSTQAPVLAYAREHGLEAHSLALGNAVYIRGATLQAAREMAALPGGAELRLERTLVLDPVSQPVALPAATREPGSETAWCTGDGPPYAPAETYDVETVVFPTMHVAAIDGYFALDPMGRTLLRNHVQIVDEAGAPLVEAMVKTIITPPDGEKRHRSHLTKLTGYARFHWGCSGCTGLWTLGVDEVENGIRL